MSDALLVGRQQSKLPALPSFLHRPDPAVVRSGARAAAAGAFLALAILLLAFTACNLWRLRPAPAPANVPPAPPEWLDVPRPIHIFDLEAPALRGLPLVYSARRRSSGEGREDWLAYGALGSDAPALRLRLYRRADKIASSPPLFAAVATQAAKAGLSISRASLADLLPTRFGAFEIADVTLRDANVASIPCSGFRLTLATPALTIGGLACGTADRPLNRIALACLLDRLDLRSGGDDRAMIDFFAASERRRDPNCRGAGLAPDALHAAWLDDKPVTHARTSHRR